MATLIGKAPTATVAITASLAVRELCIGKQFGFEDRGTMKLKGIPEPTIAYRVSWQGAS